jgi:hypothetical protein
VLLPLSVAAQGSRPSWLDSDGVSAAYPSDAWYTDVAAVNVGSGGMEQAVGRAKEAAIAGVSSKIRSDVESRKTAVSMSERTVTMVGEDERVNSLFLSAVRTVSNTRIFGIAVAPTYYDRAEGVVYAFACVQRSQLKSHYLGEVEARLFSADERLKSALQLEQTKKKASARKLCENEIIPLLAEAAYMQDLLMAVDAAAGDAVQLPRSERLRSEMAQLLERLKLGLLLYVNCSENILGVNRGRLKDAVEALLSDNDYTLTDEPTEADFYLDIKATANRCNTNNFGQAFAYMDVSADLINWEGKTVAKGKWADVKGGSNSCDRAVLNAIKEVTPQIWDKIATAVRQ